MKRSALYIFLIWVAIIISACTADGRVILVTPDPDQQRGTPQLFQLTDNGCCVQSTFSPDSETVLFIDKPNDDPAAIYGIDVANPGTPGDIELIYDTIGFRSPDHGIVAYPEPNNTRQFRFFEVATGQSWLIDTFGNHPIFSADGRRIFWNATDRRGPYDEQRTEIWVANTDGTGVRRVSIIYGGQAEAWLPSQRHILISGRDERIGLKETLFILSLEDGSLIDLAQENRLHGVAVSPDGGWVTYYTTFADDPADNGVWAVRTDGNQRRKLDFFGPYTWRDSTSLLYIPLRTSADMSMMVMEVDVETGKSQKLTSPDAQSFSISNGDWQLSPDGNKLVFASSDDNNLWLLVLPEK